MKRRVPRDDGQSLARLLRVISRVDPQRLLLGKPDRKLTFEDRMFIAQILRMIANDEDARELFHQSAIGTGKKRPPQAYSAALVYLARIELKEWKPGKAAIGKVAKLAGLTDAAACGEGPRRHRRDRRAEGTGGAAARQPRSPGGRPEPQRLATKPGDDVSMSGDALLALCKLGIARKPLEVDPFVITARTGGSKKRRRCGAITRSGVTCDGQSFSMALRLAKDRQASALRGVHSC